MVHSFCSVLYSKNTELTHTCCLKEGVLMSDPLEKDPSDAVENRRRAAVQSSTSVEIQ